MLRDKDTITPTVTALQAQKKLLLHCEVNTPSVSIFQINFHDAIMKTPVCFCFYLNEALKPPTRSLRGLKSLKGLNKG